MNLITANSPQLELYIKPQAMYNSNLPKSYHASLIIGTIEQNGVSLSEMQKSFIKHVVLFDVKSDEESQVIKETLSHLISHY